ncbi:MULTISPECIES: radical SAM family heme chaperone HemW [Gemella]|uniref:radical SAM family heme chaperone HemW n=1 Tax=Gemella TaxID=1378 RepID=UPI000767EDDD|nr:MULTISPECIES: radical SAM family heme chaperone HemW [Gemella]AME09279.1 coproporphyrinogen III oxidase [Gemella sp. oral taxon 928]AXI26913.1 coproporphyrinogen III oxidase [Gemella sp. ND 6198]
MRITPRGVYIHIPFCKYICSYCDFNKFYIQRQPVDKYIDCLIIEINNMPNVKNIETVYIGGGTPSALNNEQLHRILTALRKKIPQELTEFTFEANPEDLTDSRVALIKNYGVNRVSMGVQTFNNELLKILGRGHVADDVDTAIANCKKYNIENINVDLMFSLPKQTMEDLYSSMKKILDYNISHVSCYSLILEQKTKLYNQVRDKKVILPTNETEEKMYRAVIDYLTANGYKQYEISNFAKKGHESIHNSNYWRNLEYYGLGAGAHGYVAGVRYANQGALKFYIDSIERKGHARREENIVSLKEHLEEEMFLGLRLLDGVDMKYFKEHYGSNIDEVFPAAYKNNIKRGYLEVIDGHLRLTNKGLFYGNDVFSDFLLD